MKNYSIILAGILSLALVACGSDTEKDDDKGGNGDTTPPIVNKALAEAGTGDAAVKNFILGGDAGEAITKVAYGSVDEDGKFTAASADDLAKTTQKFLQIGEGDDAKNYHNINADAKLLLESGGLEVLYLGTAAPKTATDDLVTFLAAIAKDATAKDGDTEAKPVKYTGIVNAQWTNTISSGIKYFAEKTVGTAATKSADVDTTAATEEVIGGSVEVTVDSEGKATITPSDIGNSADSEDFGWQYDGAVLDPASLSETIPTTTEKRVSASKVWKPKDAPVITISAAGDATAEGYNVNENIIAFIDKTEVGGTISLAYDAESSIIATADNEYATVTNGTTTWATAQFETTGSAIPAGLYSLNNVATITGQVDLAFVAYTAAE